jgi:exodeoxyribonuclease V beta subunit
MQCQSYSRSKLEGCTLIDANAGSGKTRGITDIFADLILQRNLKVSEILVVTFTVAATNELKDRIRRRLIEIREQESFERMATLNSAILSMDESAIFTIHGFCRKILTEHAFESGCLYGTELVTDIDDLLKMIYYDYLRCHFLDCTVETLKLLKKACHSPFSYEHVRPLAMARLANPDMEVIAGSIMSRGPEMTGSAHQNNSGGECMFHFLNLFKWLQEKLPPAKDRLCIATFDDLIINLRNALASSSKASLINSMTKKFKAVLIDEFQDTDPIQYEIFRTLFLDNRNMTSYMIGDPKQSIYAFRGADVFSYINARKGTADRNVLLGPPLTKNYRSDEGLISAINTLFTRVHNVFIVPEIRYEPSHYPADKKSPKCFRVSGRESKPLELVQIESDNPADFFKGFLRKPKALEKAASFLVREIAFLLSKATIDDEPLQRKDIAILVRKNKEARLLKGRLAAAKIPAVYYSSESIFLAEECNDLICLLRAVLNPRDENLLKQALMTPFFGRSYSEIANLENSPNPMESFIETILQNRDLLDRKGFISMMRHFMAALEIKVKLLKQSGGERRIANLSQLVELAQEEAFRRKLDPAGILKWLEDERAGARAAEKTATPPQEHLLRLESDENALKIITIHKSKGLEFPVVFVPFSWDEVNLSKSKFMKFHQLEGADYRMKLCLGEESLERFRSVAEREELAEDVRLLYVAATRARHKCYMFWGGINNTAKSAYSVLFYPDSQIHAETILDDLGSKRFKEYLKSGIRGTFEELEKCDSNIEARSSQDNDNDEPGPPPWQHLPVSPLAALPMPAEERIEKNFRISSFSGLVHGAEREPYIQDYDPAEAPDGDTQDQEAPSGGFTVFDFPGGTKAGSMLHSILEELDFQEKDRTVVRDIVERRLRADGYDAAAWADSITEMISMTMSASLDRDDMPFTLSAIPLQDRMNELRFLFPVTNLAKESFKDVLGSLEIPDLQDMIEGLSFSPFKGYITGAIDCIVRRHGRFYLFDWKSNFLGSRPADYGPASLKRTMGSRSYFLQSFLYAIALDAYLSSRLGSLYHYDRHFGGAYYLFLRGIEGSGARGIHFEKLPGEQIRLFKEKYIALKGGAR